MKKISKIEKEKRDIYKTLNECRKNKTMVFSWMFIGKNIFKSEMQVKSIKMDRNTIVLKASGHHIESLNKMVMGSGKVNIFCTEHSLVFQSHLKNLDKTGRMELAFPIKYLFHERRNAPRYYIDQEASVEFSIRNDVFTKYCLDLSEGGFSIVTNRNQEFPFGEGHTFKKMKMTIDKKIIEFNCEVRKILLLKPFQFENCPYGEHRISFKFTDIEQKDKETIRDFLLRYNVFNKGTA
jgi:c-di-GMP-binding flagellar brake protein YcgR